MVGPGGAAQGDLRVCRVVCTSGGVCWDPAAALPGASHIMDTLFPQKYTPPLTSFVRSPVLGNILEPTRNVL